MATDLQEDPAASRRRFLQRLRQLRAQARLTQKDVADRLEWSPSKVIRIEQGDVTISTTDLRALIQLYGLDEPANVEELLTLSRASKRQSSWNEFRDVHGRQTITFFGYESSASIIRQYEPLLIPGLLQTEEYMRALLMEIVKPSPLELDRLVEARTRRQEMLERVNPPEMFFIIDEAAAYRQTGGARVMARQLHHLEELSTLPAVTIQIVPFSAGAYDGLNGPFEVLEFPSENDDSVLYLESRDDVVTRDDVELTASLVDSFWQMEARASKPTDLGTALQPALATMEKKA